MTFNKFSVFICIAVLSACSGSNGIKYDYIHPVPYSPEVYVCYRTTQSPTIDGILDENEWTLTQWSGPFVDIEGDLKPQPPHDTYVKMMWDDNFLYIGGKMNDDHIWATLKQRDTIIFQNNDFEVFIDPDGDTHNYAELEINALNTVWDLLLLRPYREDTLPKVHDEWNIENLQTAVHIEGSLNDPSDRDQFWTVEIAIPMKSITALRTFHGENTSSEKPPLHGEQWRINFSRVAWHIEIKDGGYVKSKTDASGKVPYFPQENWVWSPSGRVNMHQPETWGYLQFSNNLVSEKRDPFIDQEEEIIKWALRSLYFQQREYFTDSSRYAKDFEVLTLPRIDIAGYQFSPEIIGDSINYTIRAKGPNETAYWFIRQDGKVWTETE